MSTFEFDLSAVPEGFGADLPAGNFTAKLMASPEMTETSEKKQPMLSARFEILEPDQYKGKEQVLRYVLAVTMENGTPKFSQGLVNLKRDLKAIGEEIPAGFKLTSKNAVKYFGTKFQGKLVNLNSRKYKPKGHVEGQDLGTSYSITGIAKLGQNKRGPTDTASTALAALAGQSGTDGVAGADGDEEDEFA